MYLSVWYMDAKQSNCRQLSPTLFLIYYSVIVCHKNVYTFQTKKAPKFMCPLYGFFRQGLQTFYLPPPAPPCFPCLSTVSFFCRKKRKHSIKLATCYVILTWTKCCNPASTWPFVNTKWSPNCRHGQQKKTFRRFKRFEHVETLATKYILWYIGQYKSSVQFKYVW